MDGVWSHCRLLVFRTAKHLVPAIYKMDTALQLMSAHVYTRTADHANGIVKRTAIAEAQLCFRATHFAQLPLACLQ